MKLLFVEDDKDLIRSLLFYFHDLGYICEKAGRIQEAEEKLFLYEYDCLIIDLGLPDGNALDLLESLKNSREDVGILVLSASSNLDNKVKALELGADDYLTKPFHLSELNARIRSIIRRKKQHGKSVLNVHEIEIDTDSNRVSVHENEIKLTKKEYDLLLYFVFNRNKVLSKSSISEHLWGDFMDQSDRHDAVYSHVKNLKKKLSDKGSKDYIQSLYSVGYIFKDL
ncbi:MAG: response regulator transcription factor [Bacteroidetes bacterium]|nr:MAG: response regulator transcription factor [Bacteroidota bacterium]